MDWTTVAARLEKEQDDSSHALLIESLGMIIRDDVPAIAARAGWLMTFAAAKGLKARKAVLDIIAGLSEEHPEIPVRFIDELFSLAFARETDGNIIAKLSTPLFVLYKRKDSRLPALAEGLVERCAPLPTQACRLACATLRHLFALIMRRMDQQSKSRLFARVPGFDRSLARMIIQGGAQSDTQEFSAKLQAIAGNPTSAADIITLAQFLRRELRVSGLERWPELYEIVALA